MNILFFTYDFPYPTDSGGKTRAYNLLKFAKKDTKITLFSFTRPSFQERDKKGLEKIGVKRIITFPRKDVLSLRSFSSFFSDRSLHHSLYFDRSIADQLILTVQKQKIDLIHFESFYTGFYISNVFRDLSVKQIYGSENIEYRLFEEQAKHESSMVKKLFFNTQVRKVKREEVTFYQLADAILTVTEAEKAFVRTKTNQPCFVIPNGVNPVAFENLEKNSDGKTLLFVGNFTYFPNVDAMRFFTSSIFPNLPKHVRLLVIGKNASKMPFLRKERIWIEESIESIADAYRRVDVFVSPMRVGGGTNLKVLEAMASRIPVIALADRIKDFGFSDGKELLIASNADEFVQKIIHLLEDKRLQRELAMNARKIVTKYYNWSTIGRSLNAVWKEILHENA